jgi:hypothetical protein
MRLLPLQTLLMPVSPAKETKLNDFVPPPCSPLAIFKKQ